MKRLFLMRHAKSSWEDASLADFDRPLNDRGTRTAPFMGALIKRLGYAPAIILSSPAVRARETALSVKRAAGLEAHVSLNASIYEASPRALTLIVEQIDDSLGSALLVGHNPGLEGFLRYLTGQIEPMPTAALAVIDLEGDQWSGVQAECGKLVRVYRPKEEMRIEI